MTEMNRRDANCWIGAVLIGLSGTASGLIAAARPALAIPADYGLHPHKGLIRMTKDMSKLSAEHFETLVGETFVVGEQQVTLRSVRRGPDMPTRFRQQFALIFDVPDGSSIRSEVVPVAHPAVGEHQLLVTQVIDNVHTTALEICFS